MTTLTIAQTIQADQEPRRFRELRETLAREKAGTAAGEPAPQRKPPYPTARPTSG